MKAKTILQFMLTNYVSNEQCVIVNIAAGERYSKYFGSLAKDGIAVGGEYFSFWSCDVADKKLIEEMAGHAADVELQALPGFYILMKIED